jgi:hypothetical protein
VTVYAKRLPGAQTDQSGDRRDQCARAAEDLDRAQALERAIEGAIDATGDTTELRAALTDARRRARTGEEQ